MPAWHLYRFTRENCHEGIRLLEELVAENPNASGRHEALAMGYLWSLTFGWAEDGKTSIDRRAGYLKDGRGPRA